jgi:hypothetical protein
MKKSNKMEAKKIDFQMKVLEIKIAQKNAVIALFDSEIARKNEEIEEHNKRMIHEEKYESNDPSCEQEK